MTDVALELSAAQRESIGRAFTPNSHGELAKVCIWDGAIRSGKTIASLFAFLMACADPPPGGAVVVVGRTRESIARNVFDVLGDPSLFGEFASFVSYTPGAATGRIYGRTVHVLGASDVRSEMVLRGLTVGLAYVDELTLISEPFWTQLLGRMSPPGSRIFATTNPDGPHHWAHRMVIKRITELGYKRFHFLLADNEWLTAANPSYVAQLDREYVGLWRRRFLLGEWVQAEGAVYAAWDEARHVVKAEEVPPLDCVIGVALDFGTQHPTRAYALGIGPDWRMPVIPQTDPRKIPRVLYTVAEFAPESDLSPARQSARFRAWLDQVARDFGTPEWVFVDPAAKHFRSQLFDDGLITYPAHNAKDGGIQTLNALMAVDRIAVSDACPALIEHIPGYLWDAKAAARGVDEPVKVDDDELDAWRYVVYSTRRFWRDQVSVAPAFDHAPGVRDGDEFADAA